MPALRGGPNQPSLGRGVASRLARPRQRTQAWRPRNACAATTMPSVMPRRHSCGASALGMHFNLLFETGSADEGEGAVLRSGSAAWGSSGATTSACLPLPLKAPALRRAAAAAAEPLTPSAAAACCAQLAAPRGDLERTLAQAAAVALARLAMQPAENGPASPGCAEAVGAARLAAALREAGFDAHAVGEAQSPVASASAPAGIHRNPLQRAAARLPAWTIVDPAGARLAPGRQRSRSFVSSAPV